MPSHGGKGRFPQSARLYASAPFDVTELSFSDVLAYSNGVIAEAETLAAEAYGAEKTLFFASGATDAVRTALLTLRDKRIACVGDMHKCFHSAARLFSLDMTFLSTLDEVEKGAFDALCVTSPDYYGRVRPIAEIAAFCKEKGLPLLVDEAHGAHFAFSSLLPESAVKYADLVVHGAHKTLPVYTGGAMLHVKESFYERAREARAEAIGTSPSYLVMASLDCARELFQRKGEKYYASLKRRIDRVKRKYPSVAVDPADDFTRVVIRRENAGQALAAALEKKGIYVEASDDSRVVLIVTPFNARDLGRAFRVASTFDGKNAEYPELSDIIGKVSAYDIGVYPPGVPLVRTGEIITAEKAEILRKNLDRLFGTINGKIVTR